MHACHCPLQDLDDTLDTLIEAASRYDRRQLGPAGLKAWEVSFVHKQRTTKMPFILDA